MKYCKNCGELFEDEQLGSYNDCPFCGSENTIEAEECPICGEHHGGYIEGNIAWCCPECFQKELTTENFLKFATSGTEHDDDPDVLEDFIMLEVFNISEPLKYSSYEFKAHCKRVYEHEVDLGKSSDFLREDFMGKIKDYFFRVPDMYSCFTEWLVEEHKKEVKK